jgi:hypothetical protein
MASIGGDLPMTHVYYQPIRVTLTNGKPATIHWRGLAYRVLELNEPWRLMDRWWEPAGQSGEPNMPNMPGKPGVPGKPGDSARQQGRSDRTYYRLRCVSLSASAHEALTGDLYCDIYFEAIGGVWILERVYD